MAKCYHLPCRWRVTVPNGNVHILQFYPSINLADLFVHGKHHEVVYYHSNVCTGHRATLEFARKVGMHMEITEWRNVKLTARLPKHLSNGRWVKR